MFAAFDIRILNSVFSHHNILLYFEKDNVKGRDGRTSKGRRRKRKGRWRKEEVCEEEGGELKIYI